MTRFAVIETENTAPLIAAMGSDCDVLKVEATGAIQALDALTYIAERNAMRRAIRYPKFFGNAFIKSAYKLIYKRKISRQYGALYSQLAADTSRTALIFNGFLAPNALVDMAAQSLGMNCLYVENGFFPGTLQADRSGINGLSSLPRDAAFYDALSETNAGHDWPADFEVRQSKLQEKEADGALPERYVFVPFQVPSDMQILALSPWIDDMKALYAQIHELASANPSQHFVIKEHPSFPLSIQGQVQTLPNIHFANHAVTRDLLDKSDAVVTVNSTVGLEALVLGKKVITLGNAHYAIDGLVLQADDSAMLHSKFAMLYNWTPDAERREKFIRFVFNRFLIPGDRKAPTNETVLALTARALGQDAYSKLIAGQSNVTSSH
ncbi:MAG: nitrogen fixation protein FixF [Pseudomonadota bacterium]